MANKRRSSRKSFFSKNLIFWLIVLVLIIAGFILLNKSDVGADTVNPNITYQEEFTDLKLSPSQYKVQLKDVDGKQLSADALAKMEVTSKVTGKDCGAKGTPSHKAGGCFTIKVPAEQKVAVDSTGTMTFENKLVKIHQTITYIKTGKQKVADYYSGAIGSDNHYIIWKKNEITIKDKASGKEITAKLPELVIPPLANTKTNQEKAAAALTDFNNASYIISLAAETVVTFGSNAGTPAPSALDVQAVPTPTNPSTSVFPTVPTPTNPNISKTGTYAVSFTKSGVAVPNQKYKTTEKYKTCEMTENKEINCSKTQYTDGSSGTADAAGVATFTANLIVIGDNYFVGIPISATKFKVYSGVNITALNDDGKKIGQASANSPYYRNVSHVPFWKVMDATERSKDKAKMIKKFDDYMAKKYQVRVR